MAKIELVSEEALEQRLLECLERRELPDYFLYVGDQGVQRWLELDRSDDFPIASRLTGLLVSSMRLIARQLPPAFELASVGCGAGTKERAVLERLGPDRCTRYVPVDVSSRMVDAALTAVSDLEVETTGLVALFEDLPRVVDHWQSPVVLCMLGNNVCNYHPDDVMGSVRSVLGSRDYFLFDCHLFSASAESLDHWQAGFTRAYHSEPNVRFNIGPLTDRGVDPDDCDFGLELVPVDTPFGRAFVTQKTIRVLDDVRVAVGGGAVELQAGDTLSMGFTYKYRPSHVQGFLRNNGLETVEEFVSRDGENLVVLARAAPRGL